jgi:hypothetical protein
VVNDQTREVQQGINEMKSDISTSTENISNTIKNEAKSDYSI